MTLRIQSTADGVRFGVRVQPRAARSGVVGGYGDAIKVRITAPAVEGAANDALVELLAATFGVRADAVTIVAGAKARSKIVELRGVTEARVRQLLQP
ncbi:MAG TPA: DUF167 domain-containing protein [Gemmatimonadaceae bacterium]|nr:DUF167 domain-containing protein [Gemmatimonadaceae bacterium]